MEKPVENYWRMRLEELQETLISNNFEVFLAEDLAAAEKVVMEQIVPAAKPEVVAYGGSMTLKATAILDRIAGMAGVELIRSDAPGLGMEEKVERRRRGLLADLYLTGTNAVTEDGHLVNLDMIGNRVAAITFGPKKVVVLAGRNKVAADLETAMMRIKELAAPANAMRLDLKNPCVKTSHCMDCKSPSRICNHWTITEKSFPKERIAVILINGEIGI